MTSVAVQNNVFIFHVEFLPARYRRDPPSYTKMSDLNKTGIFSYLKCTDRPRKNCRDRDTEVIFSIRARGRIISAEITSIGTAGKVLLLRSRRRSVYAHLFEAG